MELVFRFFELFHVNQALIAARREQRRFVDQIGQVRARKSGGPSRQKAGFDVVIDRNLAHVDLQDLLATADVRQRDDDLAVETARPQQCGVQYVGTIRRRNDYHAFVTVKAIHLDEQLIQGLFPFVVTAAKSGTAMSPDGVDFVDKNDTRSMLLRLFEHIPDPRSTDADEHFDEVRTGDGEKRDLRFAGDGFGE